MASQISDARGEISALSTIAEHLRTHIFDGYFDTHGTGSENAAGKTQKLQDLALLLALKPHETVFTTVQNCLSGPEGLYGVLAVMEEPAWFDADMISSALPFIAPSLHARHLTPMSTDIRGPHQHVSIIENLLLGIDNSWGQVDRRRELCDVFLAYTLGMTSPELIHRLKFGTQESAFVEFFDSPPPRVTRFRLADANVGKGWGVIATNFNDEGVAFVDDLNMTMDPLDETFQEGLRLQAHPEHSVTTILNGEASYKVIAAIHLIIRFRLNRLLRAVQTVHEYPAENRAFRFPWHVDPVTNPPPHVLQMEFLRACTRLSELLLAYEFFIDSRDTGSEIYEPPKVWAPERISVLSNSVDFNEGERSQNDDDIYDVLRNMQWGKSMRLWLGSLCDHYGAATNLIHYAKKVSRDELLKTRILLKILPEVPAIPTRGIDIDSVLTFALDDPSASSDAQEHYDGILTALSELAHDDEWFAASVQDGFPSIEPLATRFFLELIRSTFPTIRANMAPWDHNATFEDDSLTNLQKYRKVLKRYKSRIHPKIACNRAVSWGSVVMLDELIMEYYGNISYHRNIEYKHGQVSGLECWNRIFATAIPAQVSDEIAERVLVKLRADFRQRLGTMGLSMVKQCVKAAEMTEEDIEMDDVGGEGLEESEDMDFEEGEDGQGGEEYDVPDLAPQQPISQGVSSAQGELSSQEVEERRRRQAWVEEQEMEEGENENEEEFEFDGEDKIEGDMT